MNSDESATERLTFSLDLSSSSSENVPTSASTTTFRVPPPPKGGLFPRTHKREISTQLEATTSCSPSETTSSKRYSIKKQETIHRSYWKKTLFVLGPAFTLGGVVLLAVGIALAVQRNNNGKEPVPECVASVDDMCNSLGGLIASRCHPQGVQGDVGTRNPKQPRGTNVSEVIESYTCTSDDDCCEGLRCLNRCVQCIWPGTSGGKIEVPAGKSFCFSEEHLRIHGNTQYDALTSFLNNPINESMIDTFGNDTYGNV